MRYRISLFCLQVVLLIGPLAQRGFAFGMEDFGNKPLSEGNVTPEIMRLVNDEARVYHSWVNGNEQFLFKGDTTHLNAALKKFAALDIEEREAVLVPGPRLGYSFNREKEIPYDWELRVFGGIIGAHVRTLDQGSKVFPEHPRLTICVGGDIDLAKLEIPAGVTVISGAEIGRRIAAGLTISTDKTIRGWGCGQLVSVDSYSDENLAIIVNMLEDQDNWVRLNAISAIGAFGKKAERHLPALHKFLKSDDQQLRTSAQKAIDTIEKAKDETVAEREHKAALKKIDAFVASKRGGE
jgi:hypothetical protein